MDAGVALCKLYTKLIREAKHEAMYGRLYAEASMVYRAYTSTWSLSGH